MLLVVQRYGIYSLPRLRLAHWQVEALGAAMFLMLCKMSFSMEPTTLLLNLYKHLLVEPPPKAPGEERECIGWKESKWDNLQGCYWCQAPTYTQNSHPCWNKVLLVGASLCRPCSMVLTIYGYPHIFKLMVHHLETRFHADFAGCFAVYIGSF